MTLTEINPATLPQPIAAPEIGVAGIYSDWQGKTYPELGPISLPMLQDMFRKDSQARGLYSLITKPIISALAQSKITPAKGDSGEAEMITTLLYGKEADGGPRTPLPRVLREMCQALRDGFSLHEIVWKIIAEGPLKGKLGIHKLARRPASTIQWIVDEHGDPIIAHQRSSSMGHSIDKEIPIDQLLRFVVGSDDNPVYGRSYFEAAYYSYDKKIKMVQLMHLAGQAHVVPPRVASYTPNTDPKEIDKVLVALADLGMNLTLATPDNITVAALQSTSGVFPWMDIVQYHDSQMSKSVLAMFFDKDQQSTSLVDMGGKDTGTSMFVLAIEAIMNDIQTELNKIVEVLARSNFPNPAIPTFEFHELTDEQREAVETLFAKLATSAALHASDEFMLAIEQYMSERLGFTINYEELHTELDAQKKIAQQMEQEALKAAQAPPPPPTAYQQGPEALPSGGTAKPGLRQSPVSLAAPGTARNIQLKLLDSLLPPSDPGLA